MPTLGIELFKKYLQKQRRFDRFWIGIILRCQYLLIQPVHQNRVTQIFFV